MLKFVSLFILWDLGFTLAFYTMQVGVGVCVQGATPSSLNTNVCVCGRGCVMTD